MTADIVSVAFGFVDPAGAPSSSTQPPPYYLNPDCANQRIIDSPPFAALKQQLHDRCPLGSACVGRQWCIQVEGSTDATAEVTTTLQASFRRLDFFATSWMASIGAFMDAPNLARCSVASNSTVAVEKLRSEFPNVLSTIRLWASSLPQVLKQSKLSGGHTALKGSFGSIGSVTSSSSPKSSLLKFTQTTLCIPIHQLLDAPAADATSTVRLEGTGNNFAVSRTIRVDVLRSALNEVALLLMGGGASPNERSAHDPSVTGTESYQSSIGIVGLQLMWSTARTDESNAPPAARCRPYEGNMKVLAQGVVLELQFLTQTSSNAGKKAIENAVRELLPSVFFDSPSSLLIGVANQQDGSVQNVTQQSPSLVAMPTPTSQSITTPTLHKSHASWSAAVSKGATPKQTGSKGSACANTSFSGLGPSVASKPTSLDLGHKAATVQPRPPELPQPKSKSKQTTPSLKRDDDAGTPLPRGDSIKQTRSPRDDTKQVQALRDDIIKQAQLLLMHAPDMITMEAQYEALLQPIGATRSATPPRPGTIRAAVVGHCTHMDDPLVVQWGAVVLDVLHTARAVHISPAMRAFANGDVEATIGPTSKMVTTTIQRGNVPSMEAYLEFQLGQKGLLMAGTQAYSALFDLADMWVSMLSQLLTTMTEEATQRKAMSTCCPTPQQTPQHIAPSKQRSKPTRGQTKGATPAPTLLVPVDTTIAVAAPAPQRSPTPEAPPTGRPMEALLPRDDAIASIQRTSGVTNPIDDSAASKETSPKKRTANQVDKAVKSSTVTAPPAPKALAAKPRRRSDTQLQRYVVVFFAVFAIAIIAALFF